MAQTGMMMKATLPIGKVVSLEPLAPARICQQCHAVGQGEGICPTCNLPYPSPQPETLGALKAESVRPDVSTTPGAFVPPSSPHPHSRDSFSSAIYHPIFWGRGKTLFGIFIVNTFYTLLSLGIYSFWGRVRIRQFLSSQTSLDKIRFSYHGTGMELLKGSSKALVIFGIPYAFLSFVPIIWEQIPPWIPNTLAAVMVLCFVPVAVVGSHRYRLSRTAFGAIRFSFRGQVKDYVKIWFTGTFLTILTAGVYYPFFENARREFLVVHTYLGNQQFTYTGKGTALLGIYVKTVALALCTFLLTVMTLIEYSGIPLTSTAEFQNFFMDWIKEEKNHSWLIAGILINVVALFWSWFSLQASKQRYFWNHSTFGNAPFQFTASTLNLMELRVTNFLMLLLTFGLSWPWVQVRNLQFLYYYLGLQGPLDIHQIEQDALDASPTGEELAGYFDAGFDLG